MRRSTPIFFSSVSMFSGMVAFDVAVENANTITDTNFFRNFTGLMRANTVSSTMYTHKALHGQRRARRASMYFTMGRNASKPMLANVRASRQNTPIRGYVHDHGGHLHHDVVELLEEAVHHLDLAAHGGQDDAHEQREEDDGQHIARG